MITRPCSGVETRKITEVVEPMGFPFPLRLPPKLNEVPVDVLCTTLQSIGWILNQDFPLDIFLRDQKLPHAQNALHGSGPSYVSVGQTNTYK